MPLLYAYNHHASLQECIIFLTILHIFPNLWISIEENTILYGDSNNTDCINGVPKYDGILLTRRDKREDYTCDKYFTRTGRILAAGIEDSTTNLIDYPSYGKIFADDFRHEYYHYTGKNCLW